ncbi:MAG: glutamine synthetase III [Cytophagales bacterium]
MATLRFNALDIVNKRAQVVPVHPSHKVTDYFASNVFTMDAMKSYIPSETFKSLVASIERGEKLDENVAESVASGMKIWAISKGCTHYTHWFQPLTGLTAEKHDSFYEPMSEGKLIDKFKGSELVQQEPDASSFPNGGIRSTFEARGYTAWDPSSPAFVIENGPIRTLCIPTVFVSYTGEALDHKTPLLKSLSVLEKTALEICQYFDTDVTRVTATLGAEQEYFLVDRALYNARPDLTMCGRTVFGHSPARGQQLEDHYFGSIPTRVQNFMVDFEIELLKLGVPIKTRHNEVAPSQFEVAPIFEEVNLAVDHNALTMDIMEKVSEKHGLKVLFHEKPFDGLNGSGKHNNWALKTNTGKNLLAPSSKPKENLVFLTFFVNVIKAVHDYADLLMASISTASNDYRLGANEAPPAIMSAFIGSQMTAVLDELERNSTVKVDKGDNVYMKLGINKIPALILDNTDRNRTSPFAFTGNKFEFRAVGSSSNPAGPMTILNLIVADTLKQFKAEIDKQIDKGVKKEVAIINVLRDFTISSKKIRFEGNGYSDAWVKEAAKRGLSNINNTPEALAAYISASSIKLFTRNEVMTERELYARHEIMLESYLKKVQIESRVIGDLAMNHIVPTALKYQKLLIDNVTGLRNIGLDNKETVETINNISKHLSTIIKGVDDMTEERKKCNVIEDTEERSKKYFQEVKPYFDKIRYAVDKLELIVDDEEWPLPKYRELLFMK